MQFIYSRVYASDFERKSDGIKPATNKKPYKLKNEWSL